MKISSIQRDMTFNKGRLGLHSDSYKEKYDEGLYNEGYKQQYCGSFTGKSEAATSAIKKGGILTSRWFNKFLDYSFDHNIATSALVALGLAGVMRPATILALPGKKDKEDKIYASGHSIASAILGFVASVIVTSPFDSSIKKVFGHPDKYGSKKVSHIDKIAKQYEKFVNQRGEDGKILYRTARERFKKLISRRAALECLSKNIPDYIIAVPRAILTIALIPPILKYVFGVEKKKKPEPAKDTVKPMTNEAPKMDFIEKPAFQKFKGGVK